MTHKTNIMIIVAVSAAVTAFAGHAQQAGNLRDEMGTGQGSQSRRPPRPPIDRVLDANNDLQIDASEIAAAASAISKLDADGDGVLSASECLPAPPQRGQMGGPEGGSERMGPRQGGGNSMEPPGGAVGSGGAQGSQGERPAPPIFTALDRNGDQRLDVDELAAASSSLLSLDRDGDGRLSEEECRPQGGPRPLGGAAPSQR